MCYAMNIIMMNTTRCSLSQCWFAFLTYVAILRYNVTGSSLSLVEVTPLHEPPDPAEQEHRALVRGSRPEPKPVRTWATADSVPPYGHIPQLALLDGDGCQRV